MLPCDPFPAVTWPLVLGLMLALSLGMMDED